MKHLWIETERGMLLLARKEYLQKDGMPAWDDTVLGGVDTSNNYSMGWAYQDLTKKIKHQILIRHSSKTAQIDVERYLIFKGFIPEHITLLTAQTHEKA